jgi:hypothetical protein
MKKLIVAEKTD